MDITRELEEGKVYQARIVDQLVSQNHYGEAQLVLTVRIHPATEEARGDKGPAAVADARPEAWEREVRITFVGDNEKRLEMAVRDLERLGFDGTDISRLDPRTDGFIDLTDKDVQVRMKRVGDSEYWNLRWPPERAKPAVIDEVRASAAALEDKLASAKRRRRERPASEGGSSGPPAAGN